ncbi:hypothetical protein BANRA_01725 [Klebsiella pneumoniae]|nr:hypothetical protein BANRA_01725 [Klebsiella pneumoniae]
MKKKGLSDDSKEFSDFIELMDLCYTGRQKEENKTLKSDNAIHYNSVVINLIHHYYNKSLSEVL